MFTLCCILRSIACGNIVNPNKCSWLQQITTRVLNNYKSFVVHWLEYFVVGYAFDICQFLIFQMRA